MVYSFSFWQHCGKHEVRKNNTHTSLKTQYHKTLYHPVRLRPSGVEKGRKYMIHYYSVKQILYYSVAKHCYVRKFIELLQKKLAK